MSPARQLATAFDVAAHGHSNTLDMGGKPYILHPIRVMNNLNTSDMELQAIAIMHDVLEDTDANAEYLRSLKFSKRVIDGVVALTKVDGEDYDVYIERLTKNIDAVKVKIADLRDNSDLFRLKGIRDKDIQRTIKYVKTYHYLKGVLKDYEQVQD